MFLFFLVTTIFPASANYEHIIPSSDGKYQCYIYHGLENGHAIMPNYIDSQSECSSYHGTWSLINGIPEFPTVALPVIAVIGLMFLFQGRKTS